MWRVSARDRTRPGREAGWRRCRAVGVAAAAAGLLLVAGCSGGMSPSAPPAASGTVTVVAPPGVADAPLYIGIKDGLFREEGLNVKILPSATVNSSVAALHGGQADIAFGDYADMFYAQAAKTSPALAVVADGYDAGPNVMEVLTRPGSDIVTPSQLAGKTIGTEEPQELPASTSKPYSLDTIATWSVLSSDNVTPQSIHWHPMPASSLISALKYHQVDAILATEPTIYQAESELGAIPVLDSCTGATANLPLDGYFTLTSFAKQHSATIAAFRTALRKAQADAGNTTPVQTALTKYVGLTRQQASLVTLGTYPTSLQPDNLQRVANLMFFYNTVPVPINVSSMIAR
jgi:NitT/TauT family transport system substrate-binding protein